WESAEAYVSAALLGAPACRASSRAARAAPKSTTNGRGLVLAQAALARATPRQAGRKRPITPRSLARAPRSARRIRMRPDERKYGADSSVQPGYTPRCTMIQGCHGTCGGIGWAVSE